jgi:hypothetical protein
MSIEAKQKYLQTEVLAKGFDPEDFAEYIGRIKDDGRRALNSLRS